MKLFFHRQIHELTSLQHRSGQLWAYAVQWGQDAWALARPRLNLLVAFTAASGFILAGQVPLVSPIFHLFLVGLLLLATGASILNQVLECNVDARMERTRNRPLPAQRLSIFTATMLGAVLSVAGGWLLWAAVNPLTSILGAICLVMYLAIYTPLKRISVHNTIVGAFSGALPPLMGWAASTGNISIEAWSLFLIVFLWQIPHFYAISILHAVDYKRAGMRMMGEQDIHRAQRVGHRYAILTVLSGFFPAALGMAGWPYLIAALVLGWRFTRSTYRAKKYPDGAAARSVFRESILYLGVLYAILICGI